MENIKQLREKTGAGMVECKKALEEAGGDIEKAVEILRKKGIAKAAKRGDRETQEGIIKIAVNETNNEGYIVEVNAETDFVVRNSQFQELSEKILDIVKTKRIGDREELMAAEMDGKTVKEEIDALSGVIGEKLDVKKCNVLAGGTVVAYSHMGGKIGVLVALDKAGREEIGRDIAMQIAATNPRYISPEQVSEDDINKEKEIYAEQLRKEGKPENMIEKILAGKINKYFEEVCLIKQEFIKDESKKVFDVLGDVKIEKFIIYSLTGSSNSCGI
ncbi:MAG: translation elongation factor Ts [Patescibacteria group bacterium]